MTRALKVEFRPGAGPFYDPDGYLNLGGVNGEYASTPDRAGLDITGDLDVRAELTLTDWTPASDSVVASKWLTTGNQRSWIFYLDTGGLLGFQWSPDGTASLAFESTKAPVPDAEGRLAVRATIDVSTSPAGHIVTFYVARSIVGPWMQLGGPRFSSGAGTSIFSSTAPLELGSFNGGLSPLAGRIHVAELRTGLNGTLVAAPDFRDLATGTTSFDDPISPANDWTVQGNADVVGPEGVPWITLTAGGPHGNRVERAEWQIGGERDDEDTPPGEGEVILRNHDRLFDPDNTSGTYYGLLEARTPFRLSAPGDETVLDLPDSTTRLELNTSGDDARTPASSRIGGISGDIDVRLLLSLDDWTPTGDAVLISRMPTATERSWQLRVLSTGVLRWTWSPDGATAPTADSTLATGFTDGTSHWVRITFDADDGNGGRVARFWVSEDGTRWEPLGTPVVSATATRIYAGSGPLVVGDHDGGGFGASLIGDVYHAEVRDGIDGTIVAAADLRTQAPGATTFRDDHSNTWTLTGGAALAQVAGTGGYAFTADHASLDITGDTDIRVDVSLEDWRPPTNQILASKWTESGNQRSWRLILQTDGTLRLENSTTGTNVVVAGVTTTPVTPGPAGRLAVRAALDAVSGANRVVTFYTARSIAGPWTVLQTVTTAGTTSVFASTASLRVGTFNSGAPAGGHRQLAGVVHGFELRDGIGGTAVANPDFTAQTIGAVSFTDPAGRDWQGISGAAVTLDPEAVGDQFYGFVQDGWEQLPGHPADGTCRVALVDLLGVLPGTKLPGVFDAAVQAFDPVGYWRFDTGQSEQIRDLGSGGHDGTIAGQPTLDDNGLYPGLAGSAAFNPGDANTDRVDISRSPLFPDPFHATVLAVFRTDVVAESGSIHPLFAQSDGNGPGKDNVFTLYVGTSTSRLDYVVAGLGFSFVGPAVSDGRSHVMFGQSNRDNNQGYGIAVDQPVLSETLSAGFFQGGSGAAIAGTPNAAGGFDDNYFEGTIGAVAAYDNALTVDARQSIIDALSALAGRRSDEHIRWALRLVGVPDSLLDLDEGRAIMGPADPAGMTALDFVRQVTATEGSALYVDHHHGGRLRFRERYTPWLAQRSTIVQETFSDDPAATDVVRVEAGTVRVQPRGLSTLVNQWTATWQDGEETEQNDASVARYGVRGDTFDTHAAVAAVARGLAQYRLALTESPRTVIEGLGLYPAAAEDGYDAAQRLQILDRASYRSRPQNTGSVTTTDLQIEGIKQTVEDMKWHTDFFVSEAPSAHVNLFILDESDLDGADVLAP